MSVPIACTSYRGSSLLAEVAIVIKDVVSCSGFKKSIFLLSHHIRNMSKEKVLLSHE